MAAAREAQRRARQRRLTIAIGLGAAAVLVAVVAVIVVSNTGDDGTDVETTDDTRPPAEGSAAGKPCVPVADPLPPGAPEVPVKRGPPPRDVIKEDLRIGTGPEVPPGATVKVHYIGVACSTGTIFDSSYSRNEPASFPLGGVIPGWQEGIPGMKVGGQRLLGIPPTKAYGASGSPPSIAPDETLWFVVEVLELPPG